MLHGRYLHYSFQRKSQSDQICRCGWSRRIAPEYAEAARWLAQNRSSVRLAEVEEQTGEELFYKFDIEFLPTLKFFQNGIFTETDIYSRTTANIVKEMLRIEKMKKGIRSFLTLLNTELSRRIHKELSKSFEKRDCPYPFLETETPKGFRSSGADFEESEENDITFELEGGTSDASVTLSTSKPGPTPRVLYWFFLVPILLIVSFILLLLLRD